MATQTTNTLSIEAKTYYDRNLLERALPELVWPKYGQKKSYDKRQGKTVEFRKYASLAVPAAPLTEGVTPNGTDLSISSISATVDQYGGFTEISDVLDLTGIDKNISEATDLLGEQAGLTLDTNCRNVILAGTNVQYAGGRANRAALTSSDKMSTTEALKAARTLKKYNIKQLNVEDNSKSYVGIVDPYVEFDIMNDTLFQDVSKYNGGQKLMDGEIGKLGGIRFVRTSNYKITEREDYALTSDVALDNSKTYYTVSGGVYTAVKTPNVSNIATYYEKSIFNVHNVLIMGADAYGIIDIAGSSKPEVIVKDFGSAGSADPLDQRATVGWKALSKAVRLNELAMIRIECAATEE